jgi:hypothetical protein
LQCVFHEPNLSFCGPSDAGKAEEMKVSAFAGDASICRSVNIAALALNEVTCPSVFLLVGLFCFLFLPFLIQTAYTD